MAVKESLSKIKAADQKVLVVGLGVSGLAAAKLLSRLGLQVVATDRAARSKLATHEGELKALESSGVELHFEVDGQDIVPHLSNVALCVLSPGVSLESQIVGAIKQRGVEYTSELELAVELLGGRVVAVTGSNGKSTTVSLIDHMLRASGFEARLCGNIGIPVVSLVDANLALATDSSPSNLVLVVEVSSYQLESSRNLKPQVAVWLNISDNHLERHGTLERYVATKARLFEFQDRNDWAVLNNDDPFCAQMQRGLRSKLALFGRSERACEARALVGTTIELEVDQQRESYSLQGSKLVGLHNRYNIAAALLAARLMGAAPGALQQALQTFEPLEHRIEHFLTPGNQPNGVVYINDSKSTTVASSVAAFTTIREAYPDKAVVLMLGGLAKAGSWEPLMKVLSQHAASLRGVVCFGKDRGILANHCAVHGIKHTKAVNMSDGVQEAAKIASPRDVVLFSPGCASFDEFSDFEDRGRKFKSVVESMCKETTSWAA